MIIIHCVYLFWGMRRCVWNTSAVSDDVGESEAQLVDGAIVSILKLTIVSGVVSTVKRTWNSVLKETMMDFI